MLYAKSVFYIGRLDPRHLGRRGQSLIEYMILVALMGVATLGMVRQLNHVVQGQIGNVINSLIGGSAPKLQFERVKQEDVNKKDLSNFMNGSGTRDRQ